MTAKKIGEVGGESAMLSFIVADAETAAQLPGHEGTDASMNAVYDAVKALDAENRGLIVDAGASHLADVWAIDGGFATTAFYPEDDDPSPDALGRLVDELEADDTEQQGAVVVTSGVLAIMLEYQPGSDITTELLERTRAGEPTELPNGLLLPCPNGTYDIHRDELEHESEFGEFEARVRILRRA